MKSNNCCATVNVTVTVTVTPWRLAGSVTATDVAVVAGSHVADAAGAVNGSTHIYHNTRGFLYYPVPVPVPVPVLLLVLILLLLC